MMEGSIMAILLGVVALLTACASADFLWTSSSCLEDVGTVMDGLCCRGTETFCKAFSTEGECKADAKEASIYCSWIAGKCKPKEDRRSNVCCRGQKTNPCADMFAGKCPKMFQVKKECCPADSEEQDEKTRAYSFLKTDDDDKLTCCNAPCAAMEKNNCTLTSQCAPSQRSYALGHPYETLGFLHDFGYPQDYKFGTVLYETGFGYDVPRRRHHKKHKHHDKYEKDYKYDKDYDFSEDYHVDEPTVDDLFLMMIDGMEKETDVKIYDSDITSDPYLGKTKSGGLFVDHSFRDPHYLFDDIYGSPGHYEHYRYPIQGKVHYEQPYYPEPHYSSYSDYGHQSYGQHEYGGYGEPHYDYAQYHHGHFEPYGPAQPYGHYGPEYGYELETGHYGYHDSKDYSSYSDDSYHKSW